MSRATGSNGRGSFNHASSKRAVRSVNHSRTHGRLHSRDGCAASSVDGLPGPAGLDDMAARSDDGDAWRWAHHAAAPF